MVNRNKELLVNTIILSIGQVIPKILALLILPILTTYLSTKDYGLYELSLSVASFCIPVISIQIQQAVFRYLIGDKKDSNYIISSSFYFILISFVIFTLPIVFLWYVYTDQILVSIMFCLVYFSEMLLTWSGQTIRGLGGNLLYSIAYIIYSCSFLSLIIIFIVIKKNLSIEDTVISMIISYFLSSAFLFVKKNLFKFIKIRFIRRETLYMLISYSSPMIISSIALWVVNLSDRFFVSGFLGIEVMAVYAVANKIPNLFNSFYGVFNLAWTENASRLSDEEKRSTYYSDFFEYFYSVMVGMMLILICISPIIFRVLIIKQYNSAITLMPWLFIGTFFNSLVSFFGSIYIGEKRTKDVGISSVVGAVINVLINLVFMKKFGVIVAALSTIVSFAIICFYRAIDIKKYITINYDYKRTFTGLIVIMITALLNSKYSIFSWIVSFIVMFTYNYIYNKIFIKKMIYKLLILLKGKE